MVYAYVVLRFHVFDSYGFQDPREKFGVGTCYRRLIYAVLENYIPAGNSGSYCGRNLVWMLCSEEQYQMREILLYLFVATLVVEVVVLWRSG